MRISDWSSDVCASDLGADVVCVDIDELAAKTTAVACEDHGVTARAHVCDVADRQAMEALAERVHDDHGVLDVVVNNAGVGMSGRLADMSPDDCEWIRSINLDGPVPGIRLFGGPDARARRGPKR